VNHEKPDGRTGVEKAQGAEVDDESGGGPSCRAWDEDGLNNPGCLVGELKAKLREMLLECERIKVDPYGKFALSHTDKAAVAVGPGDKAYKVLPAAESSPAVWCSLRMLGTYDWRWARDSETCAQTEMG